MDRVALLVAFVPNGVVVGLFGHNGVNGFDELKVFEKFSSFFCQFKIRLYFCI